jgi:hypothetical protein
VTLSCQDAARVDKRGKFYRPLRFPYLSSDDVIKIYKFLKILKFLFMRNKNLILITGKKPTLSVFCKEYVSHTSNSEKNYVSVPYFVKNRSAKKAT